MEALLNLLKQQNPDVANYFEMMKPLMEQHPHPTEDTSYEEVPNQLEEEIEKLTAINNKLFKMVNYLQKALRHELNRNDELAKAIGACPDCFGENHSCTVCRGFGKAGYYIPDFVQFNKFINPSIRVFNQHYYKQKSN